MLIADCCNQNMILKLSVQEARRNMAVFELTVHHCSSYTMFLQGITVKLYWVHPSDTFSWANSCLPSEKKESKRWKESKFHLEDNSTGEKSRNLKNLTFYCWFSHVDFLLFISTNTIWLLSRTRYELKTKSRKPHTHLSRAEVRVCSTLLTLWTKPLSGSPKNTGASTLPSTTEAENTPNNP